MGEKSSGTCFLMSSGCPPSGSQKPGGSWFCMRVVISAFPLRSFLFIFSANNLKDGKQCTCDTALTTFMGWNWQQGFYLMFVFLQWIFLPSGPDICVLPGLCGAAEGSVGSSPDKDFHSCVQQEDVATKKRKTGCNGSTLHGTQCTYQRAVGTNEKLVRVCSDNVKQREEGWKALESSGPVCVRERVCECWRVWQTTQV